MNKNDIAKMLNRIYEILENAKQLTYDAEALLNTDTSGKFSLIQRNKFLTRTRDYFYIQGIIETYKLYGGKNDDFKLEKLLNILINNYSHSEWKNDIELIDLKSLYDKLSTNEISEQKRKLIELRNQHYAHAQKIPENNTYDIGLYFEGLKILHDLAYEICYFIFDKIFKKYNVIPKIDDEANVFLNQHMNLLLFKAINNHS